MSWYKGWAIERKEGNALYQLMFEDSSSMLSPLHQENWFQPQMCCLRSNLWMEW